MKNIVCKYCKKTFVGRTKQIFCSKKCLKAQYYFEEKHSLTLKDLVGDNYSKIQKK